MRGRRVASAALASSPETAVVAGTPGGTRGWRPVPEWVAVRVVEIAARAAAAGGQRLLNVPAAAQLSSFQSPFLPVVIPAAVAAAIGLPRHRPQPPDRGMHEGPGQ